MGGARLAIGGTALVACVHDRVKREVITEQQVVELGATMGLRYDSRRHQIHRCACCDNLFVDQRDTPRFCAVCLRSAVHPLGGPLPTPIGVVDG